MSVLHLKKTLPIFLVRKNRYDDQEEFYVVIKEKGQRELEESREEVKRKVGKIEAEIALAYFVLIKLHSMQNYIFFQFPAYCSHALSSQASQVPDLENKEMEPLQAAKARKVADETAVTEKKDNQALQAFASQFTKINKRSWNILMHCAFSNMFFTIKYEPIWIPLCPDERASAKVLGKYAPERWQNKRSRAGLEAELCWKPRNANVQCL